MSSQLLFIGTTELLLIGGLALLLFGGKKLPEMTSFWWEETARNDAWTRPRSTEFQEGHERTARRE